MNNNHIFNLIFNLILIDFIFYLKNKMLQKLLFETSKKKDQEKFSNYKLKHLSSLKYNPFLITKKVLYHKYSKFEYSFSLFCTNNLIFNEKCRIVARFKDFLVLDDTTEFLRRFYSKKELKSRLNKIFNFYESYCKIFPNYMILPESQFLYRNIRKKQKMIDAFNEIKKEEEENRKHLKLGIINENIKNKEKNLVFTKDIQDSIERYHPSLSNLLSNTFMNEINNNINNELGDKSIPISINSQAPLNLFEFDNFFNSNRNSFLENDYTLNSQNSIVKIVKFLNNDNNNKNTYNDKINNNLLYKINKIEYKNNTSQSNNNKIIKKNNTNYNTNASNNNSKHNTKKLLNTKNNNNYNIINSNSNKNLNLNKKDNLNNLSNDNNKKESQENKANINNKKIFISHKQTVSVPIASNMLNNNNDNNIIEEKNTIKIINNINNIIINDNKDKTINNGMIININNNYFQLKDPKKMNNQITNKVKSKEVENKSKSKSKSNFKKIVINKENKKEKEGHFNNYKILEEKKIYTTYNTQNSNISQKNKNIFLNEIRSPNKKIEYDNNHNLENKKNYKNINVLNINNNINNKNRQNNEYRNTYINNYHNVKKSLNQKISEIKTLNNNSHTIKNSPNYNFTEINNSKNKNILGNKYKLLMNKNKEKFKIDIIGSIDNKKLSINRKIVNNYLATTQKKRINQGKFNDYKSSSLNTYNNINNNKKCNNDISEKIEVLNIYNTIQNNKNDPIKSKLDKKNLIRNAKVNSIQANNKNEFLSSFNLTKEKIPRNNINIDIININDNIIKYQKKQSIKKYLNNKTQSNSETELIKENFILNAFTNKSLKKDKIKFINDKKINTNNNINNNDMKKINVKEMKEKYHNLLRGKKFTHGSYDTTNRLHLLKKLEH